MLISTLLEVLVLAHHSLPTTVLVIQVPYVVNEPAANVLVDANSTPVSLVSQVSLSPLSTRRIFVNRRGASISN